MIKFEYNLFVYSVVNQPQNLVSVLNELGDKGWELIDVTPDGPSERFLFKRSIDTNVSYTTHEQMVRFLNEECKKTRSK